MEDGAQETGSEVPGETNALHACISLPHKA